MDRAHVLNGLTSDLKRRHVTECRSLVKATLTNYPGHLLRDFDVLVRAMLDVVRDGALQHDEDDGSSDPDWRHTPAEVEGNSDSGEERHRALKDVRQALVNCLKLSGLKALAYAASGTYRLDVGRICS